jgi:hypothetical protein
MTYDYQEIKQQCIKGFKKERGTKIGDKIWWLSNRYYFVVDGFYVYALFDVGRKTRVKSGIKDLKIADEALDEIIKTANELKDEIKIELEHIGKQG